MFNTNFCFKMNKIKKLFEENSLPLSANSVFIVSIFSLGKQKILEINNFQIIRNS